MSIVRRYIAAKVSVNVRRQSCFTDAFVLKFSRQLYGDSWKQNEFNANLTTSQKRGNRVKNVSLEHCKNLISF